MINEKINNAFNEQIKNEIFSAYLYLSMSAYFSSKDLDGMASWMKVQAQEEMIHAMNFFNHLKDRDGKIQLLAIDKPKSEWSSPLEVWKEAYKHEQFITSKINTLTKLATDESDYTALPLLHWFVNEQIEEESSTSKVANTLELIGNSGDGLIMLDRELAARTFVYPTTGGVQ